jgi:hypothetical protein
MIAPIIKGMDLLAILGPTNTATDVFNDKDFTET